MSDGTNQSTASSAMTGLEPDVREAYARFGEREARGNSPFYEEVCALVVRDDDLLASIEALPRDKRQPNLVLGAARYLGAPESSADEFVAWLRQHWPEAEGVALARATQTNEAGRCATLLPFVVEAAAQRPIALVEVGCSAGLTLFPDLYSYSYSTEAGEHVVGEGSPQLTSQVVGSPELPVRLPEIAWRGGLDLNPLDVFSDTDEARDNARWLEALVWPGQTVRAQRLRGCIERVRGHLHAHPEQRPHIIAGDVVADLDELLDAVPRDLHLVLFHSAVLAYTDDATRVTFTQRMHALATRPGGFTWISNEGPGVMPGTAHARPDGMEAPAGRFVLAVDGRPRALAGPHGQSLDVVPIEAPGAGG